MVLAALTTDTHYGYNDTSHNRHYKILHRLKAEMDKAGCKLLLHTGDWATCRQRQLRRSLEMFRSILGSGITIATALGNHDYWTDIAEKAEQLNLQEIFELHKKWFEEFNVIHMDGSIFLPYEDIAVTGFDGWYAHPKIDALTNDTKWMPKQVGEEDCPDVHAFMRRRAQSSFEKMLELPTQSYRKVVGLTHMPLLEGDYNGNPRWFDFMADKCDIICFGHSHQKMDTVIQDTHVYNAGAIYGSIQYRFIEV